MAKDPDGRRKLADANKRTGEYIAEKTEKKMKLGDSGPIGAPDRVEPGSVRAPDSSSSATSSALLPTSQPVDSSTEEPSPMEEDVDPVIDDKMIGEISRGFEDQITDH